MQEFVFSGGHISGGRIQSADAGQALPVYPELLDELGLRYSLPHDLLQAQVIDETDARGAMVLLRTHSPVDAIREATEAMISGRGQDIKHTSLDQEDEDVYAATIRAARIEIVIKPIEPDETIVVIFAIGP
jgi:hypothetical protein